jgi:3-oxoacyl-[acyl-carrier-protein] synthase-3
VVGAAAPPPFTPNEIKAADAEIIPSKVMINIEKYGNTTAASIPIALTEAWEQGKIKSGDIVVLAAFGSGFTWGSVIIKW